jgi:adenosine deaminase
MVAKGLKVMINSDDPPMFHTDIGSEYAKMVQAAEWEPAQVREFCLNGIDGSWAPDDEKRRLRAEFVDELDRLEAELVR